MPFRLENLTSSPVVLVLASGDTLRISPGEVSGSVAEVEVEASPKVEKLVAQGVIAVHPRPDAQRPPASPQRGKRRGGGGTTKSRSP